MLLEAGKSKGEGPFALVPEKGHRPGMGRRRGKGGGG